MKYSQSIVFCHYKLLYFSAVEHQSTLNYKVRPFLKYRANQSDSARCCLFSRHHQLYCIGSVP